MWIEMVNLGLKGWCQLEAGKILVLGPNLDKSKQRQ